MYSVRSAYRTLIAHLNFINPAHSSQIWKKLWLLKIHPKVRKLIWCICQVCLPTKENLRERRVDVSLYSVHGDDFTSISSLPSCC